MDFNRITYGLTILVFLTISITSFSQTTEDAIRILDNRIGFGARALGMGGAYSAVADDYSAIYWNPAGLAQMRKMEYWLGISHVSLDNDIVFQERASSASNSATKLNSIGLAFPIPTYRGSLVFALGYQRIRDFEYANQFRGISSDGTDRLSFFLDTTNTVYDFWGEPVEKSEFIADEGNINQWSAAGAVDVSPSIALGVTLNYWTGSSDYRLDFTQVDVFDNFPDSEFPANFYDYLENRKILSEYSSFSLKAGALFRAGSIARVGLGFELPQTFNVNEDYRQESSVSFDDGEVIEFQTEEGVFEYDVQYPFRFYGGASVALGPVLLSGSAEFMDWSQVEFDIPSDAELDDQYSELLDQNTEFQKHYRETLRLQFGGEVGIPFLDSQLRAGFIHDPSPREAAESENNRNYLTFGYGVLIDKIFKIDVAYLHGSWEQTTFDDLAPTGTQEDISFNKLIFTAAYRF